MTGKTHAIGGVTFGILTLKVLHLSLSPLETIVWYVMCALGGLLPDIDHPNGMLNKYTLGIPYLLCRRFKHRTFTHSILFSILTFIIITLWLKNMVISLGLFTGVWSHLLLDTLNPTGIPYLYPFNKKKLSICKVRTGSPQEIVVLFLCFVAGYVMLFPNEVYNLVYSVSNTH